MPTYYWFWDKNEIDDPYSFTIIQTSDLSLLKDEVINKCIFARSFNPIGKVEFIVMKMKKNSFDQKYLFKLLDIDRVKDKVN